MKILGMEKKNFSARTAGWWELEERQDILKPLE